MNDGMLIGSKDLQCSSLLHRNVYPLLLLLLLGCRRRPMLLRLLPCCFRRWLQGVLLLHRTSRRQQLADLCLQPRHCRPAGEVG